jgi:hypothetical protein
MSSLYAPFRVSYPFPHAAEFVVTYGLGWGEMDLCGQIMSCHAMPVFHGMGVLQIALVVRAFCSHVSSSL